MATAFRYDCPGKLYAFVRSQLEKNESGIAAVHRATGLPYDWLIAFRSNRIKNPSVNRIEFLYKYFTGREIALGGRHAD